MAIHATIRKIMPQTDILKWCYPHGSKPGGNDAMPPASKGTIPVTGSSAGLGTRRMQSGSAGHTSTTILPSSQRVMQWNTEGTQQNETQLWMFLLHQEIWRSQMRQPKQKKKRGVMTLTRHCIPASSISQTEGSHEILPLISSFKKKNFLPQQAHLYSP